jgi:hypothetical protein
LEGASELLSGDLRLGFEEVGLEMVDGGGGGVLYGMVGYRVEELVDPRAEDGSGVCCTCVFGS